MSEAPQPSLAEVSVTPNEMVSKAPEGRRLGKVEAIWKEAQKNPRAVIEAFVVDPDKLRLRNDPVAIEAEALRWEYKDKENVRKHFEQMEVDPDKGLAVIEYLRQNLTVVEYWNKFGPNIDGDRGIQKPYFYDFDAAKVADFVSEVENPVELLSKISTIVSYEGVSREGLHYLLKYARGISKVDHFDEIVEFMSHFSSLEKIDTDIIVKLYESTRFEGDKTAGLELYEPIVVMSEAVVSSEEKLLTQENAVKVESMWKRAYGDQPLSISAAPYLPQIAVDPEMASAFNKIVKHNIVAVDELAKFGGGKLMKQVSDRLVFLKEQIPEVLDLHQKGVEMSDYAWELKCTPEENQKLLERRLFFQKELVLLSADEDAKEDLMAELRRYGMIGQAQSVAESKISLESLQQYFSLNSDQRQELSQLAEHLQQEYLLINYSSENKDLVGALSYLIKNESSRIQIEDFLNQLQDYYGSHYVDKRNFGVAFFEIIGENLSNDDFSMGTFLSSDGKLTEQFLDYLDGRVRTSRNFLEDILPNGLTSVFESGTDEGKCYWEFVRDHHYDLTYQFIRSNRERFNDFVVNGEATHQLLSELVMTNKANGHILSKLLTKQALEQMNESDRQFWEFLSSEQSEVDYRLAHFLLNGRDSYAEYVVDGSCTNRLLSDFLSVEKDSRSSIKRLLTDRALEQMEENDRQFWKFILQLDSSDLRVFLNEKREVFDQYVNGGKVTEKLLDDLILIDGPLFDEALPLLTDELLEQMSPENQLFWSNMRKYPQMSLQQFFIEHREELTSLFEEDGSPKIPIFERMAELQDLLAIENLLSDTRSISSDHDHSEFWKYYKDQNQNDIESDGDYLNWLIEQREVFADRYMHEHREQTHDALLKDFVNQIVLTPERIQRWETLRIVFDQLRGFPETLRGFSMLRVAEALTVSGLTERTEVEALMELQTSFIRLYDHDASPFEKRCWNLLRRKLPFATEEGVRGEMRNQAVVVEGKNPELSWVHEAVHNYVRAQTPDYIRALQSWVSNGDDQSLQELKTLARFYTVESRPRESFYSEENRLQIKEDALEEINTLLGLTSRYYEVDPHKLERMVGEIGSSLSTVAPELLSQLNHISESLLSGNASDNQFVGYGQFLSVSGNIRQNISTLIGNHRYLKRELLMLDSVISVLHQQILPQYVDKYVAVEIEKGPLSDEQKDEFVRVFSSTLLSGMIEGDLVGTERSLKNLNQEGLSIDAGRLHAAVLSFSVELSQANKEWGEFAALAADEMTEMLIRLGHDSSEARSRVIMQDLVSFEKASYKFLLEPLVKVLYQIDQSELNQAQPSEVVKLFDEDDGGVTGNGVVDAFLTDLRAKEKISGEVRDGGDLERVNTFLNKLVAKPYFQVSSLCDVLVPGFCDSHSGKRQVVGISMGGDHYEYYPFTHYGVDGVVVLKNGSLVEDPMTEIKRIYKHKLVPAMLHAVREGD